MFENYSLYKYTFDTKLHKLYKFTRNSNVIIKLLTETYHNMIINYISN